MQSDLSPRLICRWSEPSRSAYTGRPNQRPAVHRLEKPHGPLAMMTGNSWIGFHQSPGDSHRFRGVPQSKAARLTLAGDWTSRKTTTSPQGRGGAETQNRMSTITAASSAAEDTPRGQLFATWARLELLGGTSDLSWLNPTPHAIAVYASRPLSASSHATLATKRTLLLTWTGLPPAGSRQLCLAHSLDHSSASARRVDGVNWRRRHRPMHRHYRL